MENFFVKIEIMIMQKLIPMMNKTAKDIIIKLIDNKVINGEEAFILITEVCKERN